MYVAKNGFTLKDSMTRHGWPIRNAGDIITALYGYPVFQTVAESVLWEAIADALRVRKEYESVQDFAAFIAENYI